MMLRWSKWLLSKVSRDTTSGQFIPEIDGLRFIAILSVVLFHWAGTIVIKTSREAEYDPLLAFITHGHYGVQFFFVISGAVIALPFAKGHLLGEKLPGIKNYFLRRLTRLEPPYVAHLLIRFILFTMIFNYSAEQASNQLPHLLASLGYVHNIIYGTWSTVSNVAWSLEVELQFYVLAPFITNIFLIKSKKHRRIFLVSLVVITTLISLMIKGNPRLELSILYYAQYFLTGFLLIDIYITEWNQAPNKSLRWDIFSLLAWLAVVALFYQGELGEALFVVPLFIAYCGAFKGKWSNWLLCQPLIYVIGGMCYTVYLYHNTVIQVVTVILNTLGFNFEFFFSNPLWRVFIYSSLILVPSILLISALFFILIEKPCMKRNWYTKLYENFRIVFKAIEILPAALRKLRL